MADRMTSNQAVKWICRTEKDNKERFSVLRSQRFDSCGQAGANELDNFWTDVGWRADAKYRALRYRFQRDRLPRGALGGFVQNHRMGAVQKFPGRVLEIGRGGIEQGEIQIRPEKFQHAVGFDDHIRRSFQALTQGGHRSREPALFRAPPQGMHRSCDEKPRRIRIFRPVALLRDRPGMIGRCAVTGLTIRRANAVAVLRNLDRRPVEFGQRRDQASDHAGFAHAAGMSANDDDGHKIRLPRGARKGRERTTEDGLLTFSPAAPKSQAASDTPARAAPEFPKMPRPCHAILYGAERRPGRPA